MGKGWQNTTCHLTRRPARPHLAASTTEAREKAGDVIAEQVLLALAGEFAPFAINVEAGEGDADQQPHPQADPERPPHHGLERYPLHLDGWGLDRLNGRQ